MRPFFLASGLAVPKRSLVVDCGATGAATYSHWKDAAPTPPALIADTSTEIVLNAASDPQTWLSHFDYVVNDHIDADGLLAIAIACNPDVGLRYRELCIAAAESGDFSEWTNEAGFRLMLTLHQYISKFSELNKSSQDLCNFIVDHFEAVIQESQLPDHQRDRQVARVLSTSQALAENKLFTVFQSPTVVGVQWQRRYGHADSFRVVDEEDDLPNWSLSTIANSHQFQLLAMETMSGTVYQLNAPPHSWARTTIRPAISWPEYTKVAQSLQNSETATCQWFTLPESRKHGFVCLLASCDDHSLAPSAHSFDHVWQIITQTHAAS